MDMLTITGLIVIPPVVLTLIGWRVMWRKKREIERLQDRMMTYTERHSRIDRMGEGESIMRKKEVLPPPDIQVSGHGGGSLIVDTKHKKAEILIPQNLSEEEKQIVRNFYNL